MYTEASPIGDASFLYNQGGMSIEVKVPKEIREYTESIFFGLSMRQFFCSVLAVGAAVGLYFGLRPLVGTEEVGWICILGAAPFAACGFFKYHGMHAEQVAWAWFKSEFLYPKRLVFKSTSLYYEAMKDAIAAGEKPPRRQRKNRKPQLPAGKEQ